MKRTFFILTFKSHLNNLKGTHFQYLHYQECALILRFLSFFGIKVAGKNYAICLGLDIYYTFCIKVGHKFMQYV